MVCTITIFHDVALKKKKKKVNALLNIFLEWQNLNQGAMTAFQGWCTTQTVLIGKRLLFILHGHRCPSILWTSIIHSCSPPQPHLCMHGEIDAGLYFLAQLIPLLLPCSVISFPFKYLPGLVRGYAIEKAGHSGIMSCFCYPYMGLAKL